MKLRAQLQGNLSLPWALAMPSSLRPGYLESVPLHGVLRPRANLQEVALGGKGRLSA